MARSYTHEVVIIGGGAAGIATAASLLKRRPLLDIAIVEPSEHHYYQPGWTMVGGGVFDAPVTCRPMASVMPKRTRWIRQAAATFQPEDNQLTLRDGSTIAYRLLIVAPGIRLAWEQIEGLEQTLGRNGVTSNYRYDLAPYTWNLVRTLRSGRAIFSQPPMPIKCAAHRRRRCTCRATPGPIAACWAISMSSSAMPAECCSESRNTSPR